MSDLQWMLDTIREASETLEREGHAALSSQLHLLHHELQAPSKSAAASDFSNRFVSSLDVIQATIDDLRARLGTAPLMEELLVEITGAARDVSQPDVPVAKVNALLVELRGLIKAWDTSAQAWGRR